MKNLVVFAVSCIVLYAFALVILFAGGDSLCERMFVSIGNSAFGTHWNGVLVSYKGDVHFHPQEIRTQRTSNVIVTIINTNVRLPNGNASMGSMNFSSFNWCYLPLGLACILGISTPISLKRRIFLCAISLVGVEVFLIVLQWFVISAYAELNNFGWYSFSAATKQNLLLPMLQATMVNGIGITFTIPFIVWLTTLVARGDVSTFYAAPATETTRQL